MDVTVDSRTGLNTREVELRDREVEETVNFGGETEESGHVFSTVLYNNIYDISHYIILYYIILYLLLGIIKKYNFIKILYNFRISLHLIEMIKMIEVNKLKQIKNCF